MRDTLSILLLMAIALPHPSDASELVSLGRGVACREAPSSDAAVVARLDVAQIVTQLDGASSATWRHVGIDGHRSCFVSQRLLVALDRDEPERALQAIVRSTFALTGRMPFGRMAVVSDLFSDRWQGVQVQGSAEMEFLELQVLARTTETFGEPAAKRRPEIMSWLDRHSSRLDRSIFRWVVRRELFWDLYDRHERHPLADDIAWIGSQQPARGECEGYLPCYLRRLLSKEFEYLRRQPSGRHVSAALEAISKELSRFSKGRWKGRTEGLLSEHIEDMRGVLARVDAPQAAAVETLLDDLLHDAE